MKEEINLRRFRYATPPVIHDVVPAGLKIKIPLKYYDDFTFSII
jgi:hypothetical protein